MIIFVRSYWRAFRRCEMYETRYICEHLWMNVSGVHLSVYWGGGYMCWQVCMYQDALGCTCLAMKMSLWACVWV